MKRILVVDDEKEMTESLEKILSHRKDFLVSTANNATDAFEQITNNKFDVVLTDLKMGEYSGFDVLKSSNEKDPSTAVILLSGYGTIESSVEAMKLGAFDFIEKPFTSAKLFETIDRAVDSRKQNFGIEDTVEEELKGIIYKSGKMREVIELVNRIAPGDMNVLIVGESGTGKDLIARAIHNLSKGNRGPFVPVNCGALPESLFESELFGHEKGAFTGAIKTKPGLIEFAKDGTFFFDEIAEMSMSLQVKLLRMLEERKIRRIGGRTEIDINVRIIAATNKHLEELVERNEFREDLFYRLNNFKIEIPPLRERPEDILPLVKFFMAKVCNNTDHSRLKLTPEAEEMLFTYDWPGNVRELQNVVNRAYFLCSSDVIRPQDLPLPSAKKLDKSNAELLNHKFKEAKELLIEKFEIEYLKHHLKQNDGNISKTAETCGIDRRTIHRLLNKYDIIYKD